MIKKIGGWGNFSILCLLIIFLAYGYFRKQILIDKANYAKGISEGLKEGVRGNIHLYYHFTINYKKYEGEVPNDFCEKCPDCCKAGDTVIVRYQNDNPGNNDLVVKLPEGTSIEDAQ
jgi:hypothetical protein